MGDAVVARRRSAHTCTRGSRTALERFGRALVRIGFRHADNGNECTAVGAACNHKLLLDDGRRQATEDVRAHPLAPVICTGRHHEREL
jgi:hypothetical protein